MKKERMRVIIMDTFFFNTAIVKEEASLIADKFINHPEIEAMFEKTVDCPISVDEIHRHLANEQIMCDDYAEGYQYHYEFLCKLAKIDLTLKGATK